MALLGVVSLVVAPLLFDNGAVLPNVPDGIFVFCYISVAFVCIFLAIFFLLRAYKVAINAPLDNDEWEYELYTALVDIAVRKNNKKLKFWYDKAQIEQIDKMVKVASENAELKLIAKRNKVVSFMVIDILNNRVTFTGLFI